eukprot:gene6445-10452_t
MKNFSEVKHQTSFNLFSSSNENNNRLRKEYYSKLRQELNEKVETIIKSSNKEINENIENFIENFRNNLVVTNSKKIQVIFVSSSSQTLFEKFFNNETNLSQIEKIKYINCFIKSQEINNLNKLTLRLIKALLPNLKKKEVKFSYLIEIYKDIILEKCKKNNQKPIPIMMFLPKIEKMDLNVLNNFMSLYYESIHEIPIIFVFEEVKSNIFSPKLNSKIKLNYFPSLFSDKTIFYIVIEKLFLDQKSTFPFRLGYNSLKKLIDIGQYKSFDYFTLIQNILFDIANHLRDISVSYLTDNIRYMTRMKFIKAVNNLSEKELIELKKYSRSYNELLEPFQEYVMKECVEIITYFHLHDVGNQIFSIYYSNIIGSSKSSSELRVNILLDSLKSNDIKYSNTYIEIRKKIFEMNEKEKKLENELTSKKFQDTKSKEEKLSDLKIKSTKLIENIKMDLICYINSLNIDEHQDLLDQVKNLNGFKELIGILDFIIDIDYMDNYKSNEFYQLFYVECDPNDIPTLKNIRNDLFLDLENTELNDSEEINDIVAMYQTRQGKSAPDADWFKDFYSTHNIKL